MYGHPQGVAIQPTRYSTSNQQQHNIQGYPQQHPHPGYQQSNPQQYYEMNPNARSSQQYAQYGQAYGNKGMPLAQPPSLIQPPALNVEQAMSGNSQFMQQRGPPSSHNQHSEFDTYRNQQQDPAWSNEQQIASMFWEQRCIKMLDRFNWYYERFELLRDEYMSLSDEIQKMDSEDDWHHFQQHHEEFHQKIMEMEQELGAAVSQNQQLLQQKMVQDSESVWEQRYQELLGNFKSLQEEMAHMESSRGVEQGGGVPPEQYHQLEDQYAELEYQYGEVVKELQKQEEIGHQNQDNDFRHQIENYRLKFQALLSENEELQHMIVDLQNQNKQLSDRLKMSVDRSKYEELMHIIEDRKNQIASLQQDIRAKSNNQGVIGQYESALNQKNRENDELRKILEEVEKELNGEKLRSRSLEDQIRKRVKQEYEGDKLLKQKKISELEKNLEELQIGNKKSLESSIKLQGLEKKLNYSNQEIANLNDSLKMKNQELIELRSLSYEIDKLKEIQANYSKVVEERDRLSETLKKKNGELDSSLSQVQKLNSKIQDMTNKRQEYSTRNLRAQIEDLNDQIKRSESQISKLKSIINLKEEYAVRLEEDIKKINEKFIVTEQTLLSERQNWREVELRLNNKNLDHEKRMNNLDYQFNLQLKQALEKEIKTLRKQNTDKQEMIRTMEQKQLVLSSQLAVFEKQKGNVDRDVSLIRRKEKELESLNEAQVRRFKELEVAFLAKEEDLQAFKLKTITLNSEINQLKLVLQQKTNLITAKTRAIEDLQRQISDQLGKGEIYDKLKNENGRLKISLSAAQQQVSRFKMQGESRLINSKIVTSVVTKVEPDKNENAVIQQLHQQNQYLKEQIGKMLEKMSNSRAITITHKEPPLSEKKSNANIDLNKRLNEFNSKLHFAINEESNINLVQSRSQKLASFWESERKELIDKYEGEINQLKMALHNAKQDGLSQGSDQFRDSPKKQVYIELEAEKSKEETAFYKQKVKEQEDRNQILIKINEELRSKIDTVLKMKQSPTTTEYFKEQNRQLESENQTLKARLKKTNEQNKQFRIELGSKNSKISQEYEFKLLQFQLIIQDLKRKITYLQAEKASGTSDKGSVVIDKTTKPKVQTKKAGNTRQVYEPLIPESPKYTGIQQQFQSVLGNLKGGSPSNQANRYSSSVNISSHSYADTLLEEYRSRVQRV